MTGGETFIWYFFFLLLLIFLFIYSFFLSWHLIITCIIRSYCFYHSCPYQSGRGGPRIEYGTKGNKRTLTPAPPQPSWPAPPALMAGRSRRRQCPVQVQPFPRRQILIVMSIKSSFYNEYDIKNNEKHVLWAQRSFQNHHQTFHDWCPEKIGPLPKKSDHWFTRTCPVNMGLAPTCSWVMTWPVDLGSWPLPLLAHQITPYP